ncbi:MAG: DUF3553 domain-containing protein [Bryobacterales bacterium]|nr:DUF3553 domain-containing protein [Bryobacterales bacterium]
MGVQGNTAVGFKRGDRVKHESKSDWGLGEVLHDQVGDNVQVIFEDVGLKKFNLRFAKFVLVNGEEARSDYLTALVRQANKPIKKSAHHRPNHLSLTSAAEKFLHEFPRGFADPDYLDGARNERQYKVAACQLLRAELGEELMRSHLKDGAYAEVCECARRVINKTNLIHHYEKMWLSKGLSSPGRQQLFATQLYQHLYGEGAVASRFEAYVRMLYDIGAAKWPIATYFWFIRYPRNAHVRQTRSDEACGAHGPGGYRLPSRSHLEDLRARPRPREHPARRTCKPRSR